MDDGRVELDEKVAEIEESEQESEQEAMVHDNYTVDAFQVRREATLLCLVKRAFQKRVIVFFNEKK